MSSPEVAKVNKILLPAGRWNWPTKVPDAYPFNIEVRTREALKRKAIAFPYSICLLADRESRICRQPVATTERKTRVWLILPPVLMKHLWIPRKVLLPPMIPH
jgi:hypothetical protein